MKIKEYNDKLELLNEYEIEKGTCFAYDGCHKIYILEDNDDLNNAMGYGYQIYPIQELKEKYDNSCPLRFISNWKLDKEYVGQGKFADMV